MKEHNYTSWILILFLYACIGCGLGDDSPAQFVAENCFIDHAKRCLILEIHFNKTPQDLTVEGASEYSVLGKKVVIEYCGGGSGFRPIVSWQGGQKRFSCHRDSIEITNE